MSLLNKTKNTYELTVIIPTFNRSKKLLKTLPTFIKNKDKKICFLILNNSSTDNTKKIVKNFQKKDKRIFLISHKKNIGAANNFRFGLKIANTPYVTIVSDDDYLVGDYFGLCLRIFNKHKKVGIIHHRFGVKKKNYKKKFNIFSSGIKSSINGYKFGSMIAGLSFRKELLNFKKYPKKKNKIYSYMSQILQITKNYDYADINSAAFYPINKNIDFNSNRINSQIKLQARPIDFGILEICDYVLKSNFSKIEKLKILNSYVPWFCAIARKYPDDKFDKFLKKINKSVGENYIYFHLYLIIFRFNFLSVKYFLKNIFNPNLFFSNLYSFNLLLVFCIKSIFNK